GSTVLAVYAYDALGRRIQETHGTAVIDVYFSKDWQVLEERNSSNQPTAQYVWDPLSSDTLVERDSGTGLGTRLYAQQDANGNVTALVDTTGTVQERDVYDPYGAP